MTPFKTALPEANKDTVFKVIEECTFPEGKLVKLFRDDGDSAPLFYDIEDYSRTKYIGVKQITISKSEFETGELVEVSDSGENWIERIFIADLSPAKPATTSKYLCFVRDGISTVRWKYIRKIKPKPTSTAKTTITLENGLTVEVYKEKLAELIKCK